MSTTYGGMISSQYQPQRQKCKFPIGLALFISQGPHREKRLDENSNHLFKDMLTVSTQHMLDWSLNLLGKIKGVQVMRNPQKSHGQLLDSLTLNEAGPKQPYFNETRPSRNGILNGEWL